MKYLISVVLTFLSVLAFMKLLFLLNKGNTIANIFAIIGIFLLGYLIIKTKLFTQIKSK
jgi:hypothetical protein